MGVSKAKGIVLANRLAGIERRVFVLTGDGELQEGQFWESLGSAATRELGEIVAIIDHNKIQSDTWVQDVSPLGDLEAKLRAFGWYVTRCDGHDVAAIERTFRALDAVTTLPKAIIADTVKGKGVSFMEGPTLKPGELYAYHSGAPKEDAYDAGLAELLDDGEPSFAELGLGPVDDRDDNAQSETRAEDDRESDRRLRAGARPSGRSSLEPGGARCRLDQGLRSRSRSRSAFPIDSSSVASPSRTWCRWLAAWRAAAHYRSSTRLPVSCPRGRTSRFTTSAARAPRSSTSGSLAGLIPGGPGHSHQSVRDISALRGVANLSLVEPCLEAEVQALLDYAVNVAPDSMYLRLVSVKWPVPFAYPHHHKVEPGRGWVVRDGSDAVVFGYGPWLLANAFEAAEEVEQSSGASVRLVNLPWLNRVDPRWLREVIGGRRYILTLDNHYLKGGQGEMLATAIAELALEPTPRILRVGVTSLPECGTNDEVLAHHKLDVASLVKSMRYVVPQIA